MLNFVHSLSFDIETVYVCSHMQVHVEICSCVIEIKWYEHWEKEFAFLKYLTYLRWQLWNCLNETCNTQAYGKYMFKYIQIQYNYEAKSLLRWDDTWSIFNFPLFIVLSNLELLNSLGDTMQYSFFTPTLLITAVTRKKVCCQCAMLAGQFSSHIILNWLLFKHNLICLVCFCSLSQFIML